jgi:hypothetical protein
LEQYNQLLPLVAVNDAGPFTQGVDELCHAVSFSFVTRLGNVVYFDAALMVLNLKSAAPPIGSSFPTFQNLVNHTIMD